MSHAPPGPACGRAMTLTACSVGAMLIAGVLTVAPGCTRTVDAGKVIPTPASSDAAADQQPAADTMLSLAELCVASGGTVATRSCCATTDDFASLCAPIACGCAEASGATRAAQLCICPPNTNCFQPVHGGCVFSVGNSGPDAGRSDR